MNKSTSTFRTYKYLLKPSAEQQAILHEMLRTACDLYNHARQHRIDRWKQSRRNVTYVEQAKLLTMWRNEDKDNNPLQQLGSAAAQQMLRRLDRTYHEFFRGTRGHPKFKLYRFFNSLNWPNEFGARLKDNELYIHNVGSTPVRWQRSLPDNSILKNIVVKRQNGRWWVCLQVEIEPDTPPIHLGSAIGVDVGLHHALALSDGTILDSPRYLKQSLTHLRRLQRTVSRRQKGSHGYWKAIRQVAKLQEHIANQRRNWWHEITTWLVKNYSVIVLEDMNLSFMLRNGNLSRAAHDVSLGLFRELLNYKAIEAGVEVIMVNPAYTSQICSACGVIEKKELSERIHRCKHCGFTLDRDVNAAVNILSRSGDLRQALT